MGERGAFRPGLGYASYLQYPEEPPIVHHFLLRGDARSPSYRFLRGEEGGNGGKRGRGGWGKGEV